MDNSVGFWNHWQAACKQYFGHAPSKEFIRSQWTLIQRAKREPNWLPGAEAHDLTCFYIINMRSTNRV